MGCRMARIGDVATYRKISVAPQAGTVYQCYSLPAFDNGRHPETFDGSEILSNKLLIESGDILVNKLNMRFKRIWPLGDLLENSICSTEFVPLVPNATIDRSYLLYVLLSDDFTSALSGMRTGTSGSHQRVKPEWILDYRFELPDMGIQQKIGGILSAIDDKISINNRLNDYLLELATTLFEHALDKSRTEVSLGDIVDLEDSKRIPLNSRDRAQHKGPYPYYGATAIMDYVDDYLFDGIRILLGEDGTVISDDGKPILQYVWGKYWVNNHAHILKASSIYSLEEIYIALSRTVIKHIVTGAVQMKISQRNLKNLRLTMPGPDAISNLSDLFEMYRLNVEENKTLEALRDSILPKLMSGEIDVSQVEVPTPPNNHLV